MAQQPPAETQAIAPHSSYARPGPSSDHEQRPLRGVDKRAAAAAAFWRAASNALSSLAGHDDRGQPAALMARPHPFLPRPSRAWGSGLAPGASVRGALAPGRCAVSASGRSTTRRRRGMLQFSPASFMARGAPPPTPAPIAAGAGHALRKLARCSCWLPAISLAS